MDRLDLMKTYLSVADTGSFVGAARRLGMTPQLTSKYIRALEEELGSQLFHRSTRKVNMTETGAAFYDRCARLVEDFEELKSDVAQQSRTPRGELKMTAPQCFGGKYLVEALADFSENYPEVSVCLDLADRYLNLVEDGFDLAIRVGQLDDSALVARQIGKTKIVCCASPGYLRRSAPLVDPKDLLDHDCIIDTNFKAVHKWPFEIDGTAQALEVSGRLKVNSASGARKLALQDRGLFLTLNYMVREDIATEQLVQVLPSFTKTVLPINLIYPPTKHLSAKVRAFIDFAADRFRTLN